MRFAWVAFLIFLTISAHAQTRDESSELIIKKPPFGAQGRWQFYRPTKYLMVQPYRVHILGSASTSDWMMRETFVLMYNLISALKNPKDQQKFLEHQAFIITDSDPPINWKQQRNTGGRGYSLFNEVLVCAAAFDTLYPENERVTNAWDTPVHEFGHSIEQTLGLESRSDEIFSKHSKNYDPEKKREYFAWAVEQWFDSASPSRRRETMPEWMFEYLSTVFDVENKWKPDCLRRNPDSPNTAPPELISLGAGKSDKSQTELIQKLSLTINLEDLVGVYQHRPATNDWHMGEISILERDGNGKPKVLRWRNRARKSWRLFPDLESGGLRTGTENPYSSETIDDKNMFFFAFDKSKSHEPSAKIAGFKFQNSTYLKISR